MRKLSGTLGLKKFGPGKFGVEEIWAQNIEKVEEKLIELIKSWESWEKTEKVEEKLRKLRKNWESWGKTEKVEEKLRKLRKSWENWVKIDALGPKKFGPKILLSIFSLNQKIQDTRIDFG